MAVRLFTSESVTEGHPDKVCDQISDGILDAILEKDPMARVACESMATTGIVFVAGEITTEYYVDIESIVRKTVTEIGYNKSEYGFDGNTCAVVTSISSQSADIAMGVDFSIENKMGISDKFSEIGSGDQGMMFGFACDETEDFMPLPIYLAHKLTKRLTDIRKNEVLRYLRPDGKSQVTVEYEDDKPKRVACVVISTQHDPDVSHQQIEKDITEHVIKEIIPSGFMDAETKIYINPTGRFVNGGPKADCGLTGRKIIVDTYGGYAPHGGGAFSGKDPTKTDRSGAYMARYVAKNVVASGLSRICEIEVAYAIGISEPVSITLDTKGTGKISDNEILALVKKNFDFRPAAIIKNLDLRRPIYKNVASYGHFGRMELDLPWEKTDKADLLKTEAKI